MQCRLYGFGHDDVAAYIRTFFESSLAVRSFDIAYRGEPSGHIGEFQIVDAEGGFAVQHTAFGSAPNAANATYQSVGKVYVYTRAATSWASQPEIAGSDFPLPATTHTAPGGSPVYLELGPPLAASGDWLLIGAPQDGVPGGTGEVFALKRSGASFTLQQTLRSVGTDRALPGAVSASYAYMRC